MSTVARPRLFEAYGVELEYMIVRQGTLDVAPLADRLIEAACGETVPEFERGAFAWSNELVLHVLEFKTNGPAARLEGLAEVFQESVREANRLLAQMGCRLMPGAMHPWMDPVEETRLWPHEYNAVYETYDRIFGCQGHGWSNVQSTHLNLPFCGDEEFGRLHAAVRLVLPLLPALAASSPVADGRPAGMRDMRLHYYRHNQKRIPCITGDVVPEPVYTREDYRRVIDEPIAAAVAPHDPEGVVTGEEFVNSRGAIARFGRGSIEIRLLDIQECPAADLAMVRAVSEAARALVEERWSGREEQFRFPTAPLRELLLEAIELGEQARVRDGEYLRLLGSGLGPGCTCGQLWQDLFARMGQDDVFSRTHGARGTLASRLMRRLGAAPDRRRLRQVYGELCDCLQEGHLFDGVS